ncbi:MAG: penicillin-binding protein 1C [Alphaproteobacteria bacterium]|nr:penicillin-binding protein 1C [Alphaproteobacteria bacterium]
MSHPTKDYHTPPHRLASFIRRRPVLCGVMGGIIFTYAIIRLFFTPPILNETHFSRAFYDRDGNLLRLTLSADDKYRLFTPLDKISPALRRATILYEDRWFYYHPGINPVSLVGATANYFTHRTRPIGASTITMQVARLRYDMNTKRPMGKLRQIGMAIWLDMFHSKSEILEAYLNLAPYGGNIEGVGAASLIYFGQSAQNISTIESITMATIPQNPSKRGLNTTAGLRHIMDMRRDLVHRWTARYGADAALETMADMPLNVRTTGDLPWAAPHFIDRQMAQYNNYWTDMGRRPSEITTTLDSQLQQRLMRTLESEIATRRAHGVENAAAILLNYKTMEVISYIGSANYFDKSIYGENDGVRARRSPGSTLKPLIYAAAADRGLIHAMTLLRDAKINFGVYAPENSDSEFYGPVLARDALTHSRNIPAIDLVRKIGVRNFYKLLRTSGVSHLKSPDHYGISVALGGAEVSMWELADIYATMANLGMRRDMRTVMGAPDVTRGQILSPESFFLVLDMLGRQGSRDVRIPYARTRGRAITHYWKTGTSSSFRDAWTAGIFGDYVLIVWVGNFDGRPNNAFSGAKTAAPIYFKLASTVADVMDARGTPVQNPNFLRDDLNISRIDMCDGVGGIAGTHCPHVVQSYFIPGVSPIDTSSVYRAIPIDRATGRRACHRDAATTYMAVFEFWDAEYLDMFRRAGIRRKTPPPFMPDCDLDAIAETTAAPQITSPGDRSRIVITDGSDTAPVAFVALAAGTDTRIFWFLDDAMIGTSSAGATFEYPVPIGRHTIRAMDELGGGTASTFSVVK